MHEIGPMLAFKKSKDRILSNVTLALLRENQML